jgi:hypothetical protein
MVREGPHVVYVVDAWDDTEGKSYVKVFATAEDAERDLERWKARRTKHDVYAGVLKRKVL